MSTSASQRVSALIKLSLSTSLNSCLAVRQGPRCQFGLNRPGREQQPLSSLLYTLFSLDEDPSLLSARQPGPRALDQSSKTLSARGGYSLRNREPLARRTEALKTGSMGATNDHHASK